MHKKLTYIGKYAQKQTCFVRISGNMVINSALGIYFPEVFGIDPLADGVKFLIS